MIPWRELAAKYSAVTRIDPARYEAELDAIDAAQLRAEAWEPSPTEIDSLVLPGPDGEECEFGIIRVPTVPVAAKDPARLIVALLQRRAWLRAPLWSGEPLPPQPHAAALPCPIQLLRRRLSPDPQTLTDLVRIIPAASDEFPPLLKLLERCYPTDPPPMLQQALRDLLADLETLRTDKRNRQRRFHGKVSTKREDQYIARLQALLNPNPTRRL